MMGLRTGIVIFLLLCALMGVAYYYGFIRDEASAEYAPDEPGEKVEPPEVLIKGLTMSNWTAGEKVWEMEAASMELPRFGRNAVLNGITGGKIFRNGEEYLGFSAGMLTVDGRNRMQFSEGVVVLSGEKPLMQSDSMIWDPHTQLVTVPGDAQITADGSRVSARNLIVDLKDEYIYTTGDIVAYQGDSVKITAGNMKYSVTRREMEIIGPTTITIDL